VVEEKMGLLGGGHARLRIVTSEGRRGGRRKGEVGCEATEGRGEGE